MDQAILNVRNLIERESSKHLCSGNDAAPIESSFLMEELKMDNANFAQVLEAVGMNPQWGINVDGNFWSVPSVRLPIWCSIKTYLWNILVGTLCIIVGKLTFNKSAKV